MAEELLESKLNKIKNTPLSGDDLMKICPAPIIRVSQLNKYNSIGDMLGMYNYCYLLYEVKPHVGHWCALVLNGNLLEFFDPYGKPIDSQLEFIPEQFAHSSGQDKKILTQLMIESPYELSYNEFSFQRWDKNTKDCGRWCAMRCLLAKMPLEDFNHLFLDGYESGGSDYIISLLTS